MRVCLDKAGRRPDGGHGRPDGQLCDQNYEIFAENLSYLRAASGR
jgi:hypothetical protein